MFLPSSHTPKINNSRNVFDATTIQLCFWDNTFELARHLRYFLQSFLGLPPNVNFDVHIFVLLQLWVHVEPVMVCSESATLPSKNTLSKYPQSTREELAVGMQYPRPHHFELHFLKGVCKIHNKSNRFLVHPCHVVVVLSPCPAMLPKLVVLSAPPLHPSVTSQLTSLLFFLS